MSSSDLQAALVDFALCELVRARRDSFAPLWSVESWAKLLIWLALNSGCSGDPASLEAFALAIGPDLSQRLRRLYFSRELEDLDLQLLADPAEPRVLLRPLHGTGDAPLDPERVTQALERLALMGRLTADRRRWHTLEALTAIPWEVQQP